MDRRSGVETAVVQEILIPTPHVAIGDVKHVPVTVATAKDRLADDGVEVMLAVRPLAPHRVAGADVMSTALKHHLLAVLRTTNTMQPCNNNNDFFCANILEDQAQWHDKTKGLSKLIIVKQSSMDGWRS